MLTGKQKRFLRTLAVNLKPYFQIGKEGVSPNLIQIVYDGLRVHELVKITVLKTFEADLAELGEHLARAVRGDLVQVIGRQIVLYKAAVEPIIRLP